DLWGLQCDVRRHLIEWIRTNHPEALPRVRADLTVPGSSSSGGSVAQDDDGSGLLDSSVSVSLVPRGTGASARKQPASTRTTKTRTTRAVTDAGTGHTTRRRKLKEKDDGDQ